MKGKFNEGFSRKVISKHYTKTKNLKTLIKNNKELLSRI